MTRLVMACRRTVLRLAVCAPLLAGTAACDSKGPTQPGPIVNQPEPPPAPAPSPTPTPPPPRLGVTRILAFGDSMTEGVASPPLTSVWYFRLDAGLPRSYPFKLQALLTARYRDQSIEVFNAGLAGQRAADDFDRFNRALSDARPNVVLLIEGANDLNAPLRNGSINERVNETVGAVEDMVRSATRQQLPVIVGTLPPQRPGGPKAGAASFLNRYNDGLKAMAANKGAHLVDVFAQMSMSDIGEDGLHPTEAGYQRLAEIWLERLKTLYESQPAETSLAAPAEDPHAVEAAGRVDGPAAAGPR